MQFEDFGYGSYAAFTTNFCEEIVAALGKDVAGQSKQVFEMKELCTEYFATYFKAYASANPKSLCKTLFPTRSRIERLLWSHYGASARASDVDGILEYYFDTSAASQGAQ